MKTYFLLISISIIVPQFLFQNIRRFERHSRLRCPQKCNCYSNTVKCTLQKLTRVPPVPADTEVLDLRFNEITEISPGIFRELKNLHTLLLSDNYIEHLKKDTFNGMSNLRILDLNKNQITSIEPGAFNNLFKLDYLSLNENYIIEIRKGTFNDLPALERLMLQNNDIRRIESNAFHNIGHKTKLILDSKALECTCDLKWLIEHLQKIPSEGISATCDAPHEMKGKHLNAIKMDDFHCLKPKIMEGPTDAETEIGGTIIFKCRVSGDPKPVVKWMRNSNEVEIDEERYNVLEDGTLLISDVRENDSGEYECVAHNEMGSTISRRARAVIIVMNNLIRFTETPVSQTVETGVEVTLVCRVIGHLVQSIEWFKNGRIIRPEGRFEIEENGSILKIRNTKVSDSARYVCRARGRLDEGFAETSADLEVLKEDLRPPRLIFAPQDMEAESGASIEIPCRAEGSPEPEIQWRKDGNLLNSTRNNAFNLDKIKISKWGSLYLFNVSAQDTGRYECSAINEYGRATGQALLQIRKAESSNSIVFQAFQEAREEIDRAINNTLQSLFSGSGNPQNSYKDLFRLSRFPTAEGRAAARPAELFERTLKNIRRIVRSGTPANITDQFNYEEILTPEQIIEIERLSGCTGHRRKDNCNNMCFHARYRTINGKCNNLNNPIWGSSYTGFRRILKPIYENGFSTPVGWNKNRLYYGYPKPAARLVSTYLISTHNTTSDDQITHMVMQWGQFLDHDLDHALPAMSSETWDGIDCKKSCEYSEPCFPIQVPPGDPRVTNRRCIDFFRTSAVCGSGETSILWGKLTPREQLNQLTSYLDASQVYGYEDKLARELRDLTNDLGLLKEGPIFPNRKPLLPYTTGQQPMDCRRDLLESSINCFLAGDIRANEQVSLLAMHTIWMREHNRIAQKLHEINPHWRGERLYQEARKIVGAEMQHITFRDWFPLIFGESSDELLNSYRGYDPKVDATISNVFATAALRFGHSLIQPRLERLDENFTSIRQGPLNLRDAFFSPWRLVDEGGVDPLLRGMFVTGAKLKLPDQTLNDELTEQLFRTAHAVALDLAAMNIQRGRDHAIPGYLEWREYCSMSKVEIFDDLKKEIGDNRVREKLRELYGHPGNMDVWVGGILEDPSPNAKVGPLFKCLLSEQFRRMRDGDRFWYENPSIFSSEQLMEIKKSSLARVICDNGDNIREIIVNVFKLQNEDNPLINCDELPLVNLKKWSECCEECEEQINTVSRSKRSTVLRYSNPEDMIDRFTSLSETSHEERIELVHHLITETDKKIMMLNKFLIEIMATMNEIKSVLAELEI